METRDLDGINVEETTAVDEQRSNKGKTFAKVAAGIGAGAAAGAGVMAMVDDDVTTPDVEPTELVDASDVADVTAGHIADNNAAEAWPQKHDNEAWPQKHDNEAWPQKHDNEAWPDDRDNEAWPQEQPVDAVHMEGLCGPYLRVVVPGTEELSNTIAKVRITGIVDDWLTGELVR